MIDLDRFCQKTELLSKTEVEKVELFILFSIISEKKEILHLNKVIEYFDQQNLNTPNKSRLRTKIKNAKSLIINVNDDVRLHASKYDEFKSAYNSFFNKSEDIESDDHIIPVPIYLNTRGYIECLSKQINSSYENNIYDGCAVLMRRLFEILLIHTYQHVGIDQEIKDHLDNYKMLESIVANAKTNSKLNLSRNLKENLDIYRNLGNFSAHKIHFNARKSDIDKIKLLFRVDVEELLYKAGIKK